ncbi:Hypothetical protein CINCED_3A013102 [Cinara cedri]|uniref:Uncharacterized protein n=1 Tax=Cinara cedri TaxID=506608 RepID=A0A5E4MJL0_9HEMI|nr:Hypothetical protein CINCED_3A013102 [Cinara cedri]
MVEVGSRGSQRGYKLHHPISIVFLFVWFLLEKKSSRLFFQCLLNQDLKSIQKKLHFRHQRTTAVCHVLVIYLMYR